MTPELSTLEAKNKSFAKGRLFSRSTFTFSLIWGLLTVALGLLLVNSGPYPPFHDFGEWIYQAYLAQYLLPHSLPFVALKAWPVPNSISELMMAPMMTFLSPIAASRIFLSCYILGGSFLVYRISRIHGGSSQGSLFVLLLALVVFPTPLWTGETNYQIGLVLLCSYIFLVAPAERTAPTELCLAAAFGVLIFFSHAICLAVFVVFLLVRAVQKKVIFRTCLSLVPAGLLAVTYLHFNSRMENPESELVPAINGLLDLLAYRIYIICKLGPYSDMVTGTQGDFERSRLLYFSGVSVNFIFGAVLALTVLWWITAQVRKRQWSPELITSMICILLYLWDPAKLVRVATIGERLLLPAIITAVICCSSAIKLRRFASILSGALCLALLYWLFILPHAPFGVAVTNDAISKPGSRFKLLFWHRPFLFAQQVMAAQQSFLTNTPPTKHIAFKTSLLKDKN